MAVRSRKLLHFTAGAAGLVSGLLYYNSTIKRKTEVSAMNCQLEEGIGQFIRNNIGPKLNEIMKLGFPSYDNIVTKDSYVISYNKQKKIPNWACECVTSENIYPYGTATRGKTKFSQDESLHSGFQSTKSDYKGIAYTKGHLVPAGNHLSSSKSLRDTFKLSNVAPMIEEFNTGIWHELEEQVKKLAGIHGEVYVCSGTLFLPKNETENFIKYFFIGPNKVAVPTHFFKGFAWKVEPGMYDMDGYIVPHEKISRKEVEKYMVTRDEIYKNSGFFLFPNVKDENIRKMNKKDMLLTNTQLQTNLDSSESKNDITRAPLNQNFGMSDPANDTKSPRIKRHGI